MIRLVKSTFYRDKDTRQKLADFILQADKLSFGSECENFEIRFSSYQEREFGILVNSGSSANLALIQALLNLGRLKPGDAVGFSAVTWSTNVMPLIQLGLTPVPIDIELDTLNVSSRQLQKVIDRYQLKALFLTNLLGYCDDIDRIADLCRMHNIILLEDNCESLGSKYQGQLLGNFSLASTFSFYVSHHLSTVEGGAIVTDDPELADQLKIVRAHGWDRNLSRQNQQSIQAKHQINSTFYSRYTFYNLGFNLRPTEITGFLGSLQLEYLEEIIQKRVANYQKFKIIYQDDRFYPMKDDHMDTHANFAIPIVCKTASHLAKLVSLCDGKLEIRPIVGGLMINQPFFNKHIPHNWRCPNAHIVHHQGFYMANHPELTAQEIKAMIRLVTFPT